MIRASELTSVAGTNVLLNVPVEPWPEVGLHDPLLCLELAVVSRESSTVGLFEDLGPEVGRSVQHYSVGFSWPTQASPEKAVFHKAVPLVHLNEFVQF